MPVKTRRKRRKPTPRAPQRSPEVLNVKMTAALLTVSPDLVYELFAKGELPGRKVGRKWITTKAAVLRWIENTSADDALARAIERGDKDAITGALNTGKIRIAPKTP